MTGMAVRLEQLPRMHVAAVRAAGETPEAEAWRHLRDWAAPKGLLEDSNLHPIFGFNNPNPAPGKKEYGYELWIRVEEPEAGGHDVEFKEFEGGLFAVTSCQLHGEPDVRAKWRMLVDWARNAPFRWRRGQELERVVNPEKPESEMVLELYLPVEPRP